MCIWACVYVWPVCLGWTNIVCETGSLGSMREINAAIITLASITQGLISDVLRKKETVAGHIEADEVFFFHILPSRTTILSHFLNYDKKLLFFIRRRIVPRNLEF